MDHPELATIQDTLEDSVHEELDKLVNNDSDIDGLSTFVTSLLEKKRLSVANILLDVIINNSGDRLDQANVGINGHALIVEHHRLLQMLDEAWKIKKYRSIRLLAMLQPPAPSVPRLDRQRLGRAFRAPFFGAAVHGLLEYLQTNETLFRARPVPPYYAKFFSIVQSSGTGKSRVLAELSKNNVVVLYINLRDIDDETGFPLRDEIPSTILLTRLSDEDSYRNVCHAFMAALFDTLEKYLTQALATHGVGALNDWNGKMCDMDSSNPPIRDGFFGDVKRTYEMYHARLLNRPRPSPNESKSEVEHATDKFEDLSLGTPPPQNPEEDVLISAYTRLGACLDKLISSPPAHPKLVIAFDEAHRLSRRLTDNSYRPADVLTRVINEYSHHSLKDHAIWTVFASTTSKVADFSPPNNRYDSSRNSTHGHQLFRPYVQLGWDQHAPALGGVQVVDNAKISNILKFGRPLWYSLRDSASYPDRLLLLASEKLCAMSLVFHPTDAAHVLAVLGQRFGLEVSFGHPDSIDIVDAGVASHLRICLATTPDRKWKYTTYPSEPLLSCAAAARLHFKAPSLAQALNTLGVRISQGMVNIGERGELVSRLLWLLAKDLYVRKHFQHTPEGLVIDEQADGGNPWETELLDCKMIPVLDWLQFVFGKRVFGDSNEERERIRDKFKDAYLNFSHWISMDSNLSGFEAALPFNQWTLRHWQRTSAVQCCHGQPQVDKVIPMYIQEAKNPNPVAQPERMSQIFVSDKVGSSTSSKDALASITRTDLYLGNDGPTKNRANPDAFLPYIAILVDLGRPPEFSVSSSGASVQNFCWRIYAGGIDATTYPFLASHPDVLVELQNLVRLQDDPGNAQVYEKYLDAQVRFGKTATAQHMNWERGRNIPVPQSGKGKQRAPN